jgi:hypothetical protein
MKKITFTIVLFSFFFSCQRKEENFTKEMIEKLIVTDNGLPSKYTFLDLYILTNNNEVLQTNNNYMFQTYNRYYQKRFKTFEDFLEEVLNKNFALDYNSPHEIIHLKSFKLNQEIEKQYSEIGFDEFLKKYSKKTNKKNAEFELNKSIIKKNEYLTIVYLLYKNRYDIGTDCYIGKDYIRKREYSFK